MLSNIPDIARSTVRSRAPGRTVRRRKAASGRRVDGPPRAVTGKGNAVRYDVVCPGETVVTLPGPLSRVTAFTRGIGGAESTVACCLARLGHRARRARRVGRVGGDGFGDHVLAAVTAHGDLGVPPARERADALVALDPDAWRALRIGPDDRPQTGPGGPDAGGPAGRNGARP